MLVYVVHQDGTPLMPCKPVIARLLLKDGQAKVVKRTPFTIKLLYNTTKEVQELTLGIDSGSKVIGSSIRDDNNQVYYISEIHLRQDIKSKLDQRRMYRRTRRSRKTRYRKARFLNRKNSIRKDRYSPTLTSKYQSLIKELWFVTKILPVKYLVIETGTFDIHALHNPQVKYYSWLYQKGIQFGYYNTKSYILNRDKYTCQYCKGKSKDSRLQIHHILERSKGGSNLPNNLITLCKSCHSQLHAGMIKLTKSKLKSTLNHATHMNILGSMIKKKLNNFLETFGYITKLIREHFNISKTHYSDAICCSIFKEIRPKLLTNNLLIKRCLSKGRYQQTWGIRSEKSYPKGKIFGFKTWDKVRYKNQVWFIKGTMSTGYAILSNIFGIKYNLKPIPKFSLMKRLSSRKSWIMIEEIIPNV